MNRIEAVRGDWEDDGYHLQIDTDEATLSVRVTDTAAARELIAAIAPLVAWVAEEAHERRAYDAATPAEREAVLNPEQPPSWVWAPEVERILEKADHDRKAERENRP